MTCWAWLRFAALALGLCAASSFALPRAQADAASEARTAFERGVEASREQRWEDARREFLRSRDRVVKPSTLFNLAVADMKLGLVDEALEALTAFEQSASPTDHASMLERAKALRAEAERGKEAARPATERARGLLEPAGLNAEAKARFSEGYDAYARGEDAQALSALQAAYRASKRDELLFDIGVVADRLRDDERAISAFEAFVRALPNLPEADIARRHLERLHRLKEEQSAPEPAATISESNEVPAHATQGASSAAPSLIAPRTLLVVGALVTAGAIGTALWLADRHPKWRECEDRRDECTNGDVVARQARAAWATTLVLGISGLTLLTTGSVLLAKRKQGARLDGVAVGVGGHRVQVATRFVF